MKKRESSFAMVDTIGNEIEIDHAILNFPIVLKQ